jgi:hypothetical protein
MIFLLLIGHLSIGSVLMQREISLGAPDLSEKGKSSNGIPVLTWKEINIHIVNTCFSRGDLSLEPPFLKLCLVGAFIEVLTMYQLYHT